MKHTTTILLAFVLSLAGCGGCERVDQNGTSESRADCEAPVEPLKLAKRDYILAVAADTSGSFVEEMFGSSGRAYQFTLRAIERLFRDRAGTNDRVLLAQLSANTRALLWEGTPRSLKKRFGSSEKLKDYILQRSCPNGSCLYAGIAQVLNYILSLPGVKEGDTKVCILVLSDMDDNSPTQTEDKERMIEALKKFKDIKGKIGFYFIDIQCLETTRQCLIDAGLDPRYVESGIVEEPTLPSFAE
jgi:hypothetical protein